MKLVAALVALICCGSVFAQTTAPQSGDKARMKRIFDALESRFAAQTDMWYDDGEFPRTIQLLRFHSHLSPLDYEVATNLGWLLESTEQNDEALATYIRYSKNAVNDVDRFLPMAQFFFMKKNYVKVPPLLEPQLKFEKLHPNCYRLLGHSYERQNLLKDAKRVWELFIQRHPEDEAGKQNLKRINDKITNALK